MESTKKDLSNLKFEIKKDLSEREKRFISNFIANKLTDKYPYLKLGYFDIFSILYNTPMYFGTILEKKINVNYEQKDLSLYFDENKNIFDIDEYIVHEGIHRIQDKRGKDEIIKQLGLCEYTDVGVKGLIFNEAAIQYIVSNLLDKDKKDLNIYNISLKTISDSYYPLVTNLMEQIVLLIGSQKLVESTIYSDNNFNKEIISIFGEEKFNKIRENFDKIVELTKIENNEEDIIKQIREIYFECQKIIYTSYFDKIISKINNLDIIKEVRQQLYEYAKLIFLSEKFDEFKLFYNDKIIKLKELEININAKYALVIPNRNILYRFFLKVKRLFFKGAIADNIK